MNQKELIRLAAEWLAAKEQEEAIVQRLREVEERIKELADLSDDVEGVQKVVVDEYEIQLVREAEKEADVEQVFKIAVHNGLFRDIAALFKWEIELNEEAWKVANPRIAKPLATAFITRFAPSTFIITKNQ